MSNHVLFSPMQMMEVGHSQGTANGLKKYGASIARSQGFRSQFRGFLQFATNVAGLLIGGATGGAAGAATGSVAANNLGGMAFGQNSVVPQFTPSLFNLTANGG